MSRNQMIKFLIIIILLLLSIRTIAQDTSYTDSRGNPVPPEMKTAVDVEFVDAAIKEALLTSAEKANIHLNFSDEILLDRRPVSLVMKNQPVIFVLKEIIAGTNIEIVVTDAGKIVLLESKSRSEIIRKKKYTLSGYVTDYESGESLLGANLYLEKLKTGCATNEYGFYSLTIPEGYYNLLVSYIGYSSDSRDFYLYADTRLDIKMRMKDIVSDTVVVTSDREDFYAMSNELSALKINPGKMAKMPYFLGEPDPLRTLQLLPGIASGREGDSGFYVRGGESDQNLTLLDEAPIYNAYHTVGLFSVFNGDAIKDVKVYKGMAPPKFGGRLSSILDIRMNEGNMNDFSGMAAIGLIFSRFTVQGPLKQGKSSFIISGRRTYMDVLAKLASSGVNDAKFHFYDLNMKVNYILDDKNRLFLSGYMGSDGFGYSDIFDIDWGNTTATLRWNHLFSNKFFLNSSLIYSRFLHTTSILPENEGDDLVELISKVNDFTLKEDFQYFYNPENTFSFGVNYIYHQFLPGKLHVEADKAYDFTIGKREGHELAFYAGHEHDITDNVKLNYGIRLNMFSVAGEADDYSSDELEGQFNIDFHPNEEETYLRIEPRFQAEYLLDDESSIRIGYARHHQYMHKVSASSSGAPWDVWQPASTKVKPMESDQFSAGYFRRIENDIYEFSVEAFYKDMRNLIEFRNGANFFLRNYFDSELVFGEGKSYGLEFLMRKNIGEITGWICYTLSKSERKFPDINNGDPFPARYDRLHDFKAVMMWQLSKSWDLSANWTYSSGSNITLPYGKYVVDNTELIAYTPRNGYRLPDYHRLDLSISYTTRGNGVWTLSLYNAYSRKNIYSIVVRDRNNDTDQKEAVEVALFGIIPSLSYTMHF